MDERWNVVVVGAGLAGLTAAATAADAGASVLLLGAHPPGGRAVTDEVDGFRFNRGAHALYRAGAGRPVLDRLGVVPRGVAPPVKGAKGRIGDEIGAIGLGLTGIARTSLIGPKDKVKLARLFVGMPRWKTERLADRSAAAWFDELGLAGRARQLVETLVRTATYVADMERVSADLVAVQVRLAATPGVEYLHGGWQTLVDGLATAARLRGVEIRTGATVRSVVPDGGRVRVDAGGDRGSDRGIDNGLGGGGALLAGRVVVAAGPPAACAALLPEAPPAWATLGPPARAACLDMGLTSVPDTAVLLGIDRPLYLIRHAPPAALAPLGSAVVHGMRYLRADEDPSPADARGELEEHARLAGIDPGRAAHARYLHRMTVVGALPLPGPGLAGRVGVGDTGQPGVLVAGDWVGPVGHLADAALVSGEAAGRRAAATLAHDPVVQSVARQAS